MTAPDSPPVGLSVDHGDPARRPLDGLVGQAAALAAGEVSSRELTERSLARIAATQPTLNAFRVVRDEQALAEADEADRRLAAGERAPLLGVPFAIKDDVDLAGHSTPFGCAGEHRAGRARRRAGAAAARGGRDRRRQDQRARGRPVALLRDRGLRRHPQPLAARAHAGRLQRRRGRRGRGRDRRRRDGLRRRRLDPHPRRLDQPGRAQAPARQGLDLARRRGLQRPQLLRPADPRRRRRGAGARRARRQRAGRSPPGRAAGRALRAGRGRLAAAAARRPFLRDAVRRFRQGRPRAPAGGRGPGRDPRPSSATRSRSATPTTGWSARR